ncbi:unnamed protein product [Cylicostephanus goldi]|uniref:Uncharacterized protein n=1 Tax=Cylicostephanus goldi TaxID=71465 RepID=A0A3P6T7Z5_CYLGO|nr:unnamed protein product [Cylicostephanus goldi]
MFPEGISEPKKFGKEIHRNEKSLLPLNSSLFKFNSKVWFHKKSKAGGVLAAPETSKNSIAVKFE